jgi:hypothetical protein
MGLVLPLTRGVVGHSCLTTLRVGAGKGSPDHRPVGEYGLGVTLPCWRSVGCGRRICLCAVIGKAGYR